MAAGGDDEHERTMVFAEIAIGQMKALRQSAAPMNYEVWYTYATGHRPELNKTINEVLAQKGQLTSADVERVYDKHLSPFRASERTEHVGLHMLDAIKQVMSQVGAVQGNARTYSETLADVRRELDAHPGDADLATIIENLLHSTREMQRTNQALEANLSASTAEIRELQQSLEVVRHESLTDPLTTLANRKRFDHALNAAVADAQGAERPFSLLMCDIDHFKTFNDRFGHLTGDQVLRLVASEIKQSSGANAIAARYGGEEFVVILPGTRLAHAVALADQVRRTIMTKELIKRSTGEPLGHITISAGVASHHPGDTPQSLIERADECLYVAKRRGRNRVVAETEVSQALAPAVA